ncbi:MAG TPA: GNAT family N-acetyltransferase [Phycisphaerae bacterium]|jgi:ribosomal protein S18 acetylase RimI-like enzyme
MMTDADREDVAQFIERHWHSRRVMSSGKAYYPHQEEAFIERRDGQIVGLLTFRCDENGMEILTLNSTLEGQRIGSSLMLAAIEQARQRGVHRIWLTTTNDNTRVLIFYQRLGFRLIEVRLNVVDEARKIKPEIPEIGHLGIPIHDEWVLELSVKPYLDG